MDFDELTRKLELEAQALNETIATAHHRLAEIETFLKLGRKFVGRHESPASFQTSFQELMSVASGPNRGMTQRDRAVSAAESILRDGRRRSTQQLLSELDSYGIALGGSDPAQTLSTYLSREKTRFSSDLKLGGWTLQSFERLNALAHGQGGLASLTNYDPSTFKRTE